MGASEVADRRRHPRIPADASSTVPASATELGAALEAVADPLFVVDRYWRLRYLNAAAARHAAVDQASTVGEVLWSVDRSLTMAAFHDALVSAMRDRRAMHVESFSPRSGEWLVITAYPTSDGLLVLRHSADTNSPSDDPQHVLVAERAAREEAERLAAELQNGARGSGRRAAGG